jgi:hypothetical protein
MCALCNGYEPTRECSGAECMDCREERQAKGHLV